MYLSGFAVVLRYLCCQLPSQAYRLTVENIKRFRKVNNSKLAKTGLALLHENTSHVEKKGAMLGPNRSPLSLSYNLKARQGHM